MTEEKKIYLVKEEGFDDCDFFDCQLDREELIHKDPDEAVEDELDAREELPNILKVYGFTRMKVSPAEVDPHTILEEILERLDEEYGGEDASEPTQGMIEAAENLAGVILEEYQPWNCEQTHEATIDVGEWIKEERPDWFGEEK